MPRIDKNKVKKILIIKLRGIGDVVLSTVVLKNIKNDFPGAEIHYLTEKPSNILLKNIDEIKNIHVFDRRSTPQQLKILFKIRKEKYDLVFDFFCNTITALITFLSGAYYRVGFPYKGRKFAYNIYGTEIRNKFHAADLHLETLKMANLTSSFKDLSISLDNNDYLFNNKELESVFSSNNYVVGISPSGGWESKKCDPVKLAEIGDTLINKYDLKIMILWGPGDFTSASEIETRMNNKAYLAPETNIRQMAALISKCSVLIANDSGPMHISTAVGTPVLSIHGPTDPRLQGPYGQKHEWINNDKLDCIICNLLECPKNHECFLELSIEKIMDKFEVLIDKNNISLPLK